MSKSMKKYSREFKYKINEEINGLIIIKRDRIRDSKGEVYKSYQYICKKCGFDSSKEHYKNGELQKELWITESRLKRGSGCACCNSRVVVDNINSIWKNNKYMIYRFGISEYDAKRYNYCSNKNINILCPNCGNIMNKRMCDIYINDSIGCVCGDGFRYPEKLMANILKQLKIEYKTQYSPNWEGLKREGVNRKRAYDFYLPKHNIIIETHGIQHYERGFKNLGGRSLEEEQQNDKEKEKISFDNGIDRYIIIDCRNSEVEFIKRNILKSELNNIFDLSNIDWAKADLFATKSRKIEICKYRKLNPDSTTNTISEIFGVSIDTVRNYLKWGNLNNMCEYDSKKESKKRSSKSGKLRGKRVEIFKDGVSLGVFESCSELERQSEKLFGVKLLNSNISAVCNEKYMYNTYKGYSFKYVN